MNDTTTEDRHTDPSPNDRRALLRRLAIGGAGAAAGAALLSNASASAANGDSVDAGGTVEASLPTIIVYSPAGTPTEGPSGFSAGGYVPPADSPFPAGVGGYGDDTVTNGVHGSTTAPGGFGVVAANLSPAAAAATDPVPTAQAVASPNGAHMLLLAGGVAGPTAGKHVAGEVYVDAEGTLWFTVPTDTADVVRFVKLAGTSTAGAYHPIDPQRAYDSRQPNYAETGQMEPNSTRVISVADGHSANGTVTIADVVPAGATAVQINLTAANMTDPNFLSVAAGDTESTEASLLNWGPGDVQIANSITIPIDTERQIKVFCGNQTGSTDVIVDVFGFYL